MGQHFLRTMTVLALASVPVAVAQSTTSNTGVATKAASTGVKNYAPVKNTLGRSRSAGSVACICEHSDAAAGELRHALISDG